MTRILFVLHFPPPVHGSSVVGGFIKESHIINGSYECRYINYGTSFSVEEIGHNVFGKVFRYISLIWNVTIQLILFRPDLCYFSPVSKGIGFYKDAVIIILVRIFGVRPVYHFHNKGVKLRQDKLFDNLLYRLVFKNADVILLSKYLYNDIEKYVPESRVHYCPNGISQNEDKRQQAKDKSTIEILFISHLIESKGVFILLDACKILEDKKMNFHCTMIGGEADVSEEQLRSKIKNEGLSERISIAGKKFGSEKGKAFEQADIFVHPSFSDCLPLVLLEAMQYSLPIVSTFEGAIPDVVADGKSGFLVKQKDASALAEKLELLIRDPELRTEMGVAGRAKYEREFTLGIFENRIKKILEDVSSNHN